MFHLQGATVEETLGTEMPKAQLEEEKRDMVTAKAIAWLMG